MQCYLEWNLRKRPWEHQAGVAQAISPISMKLGQFKGLNQKLKNPKWFTFWIQPGGVRPPPWFSQENP